MKPDFSVAWLQIRGILLIKYMTVMKAAEIEQTIERSRFIGHVKPVESRKEAENSSLISLKA
jgi:hypothetical protein